MSPLKLYALAHGELENLSGNEFPTLLSAWVQNVLSLGAVGTHFGYVHAGPAVLGCASGTFQLSSGMYFAVPGKARVAQGTGIVMTRLGYQGFFHVGGPVEETGRLRYIDGCTDSLLIPPVVRGDPCLNLLQLPPGTRQTPHSHPSLRAGLVIRGAGFCVISDERVTLNPGQAFVIRSNGLHCFHTDDEPLLVLAYHPDSDFGPTNQDHPMINRTVVHR